MEERLVSYEIAVLAKEKRFDELVPFFYTEKSDLYRFSECEMFYGLLSKEEDLNHYIQNSKEFRLYDQQNKIHILNKVEYNAKTILTVKCTAPTQALLQKWLREKHNIHIIVQTGINDKIWYSFQLLQISNNTILLDKKEMYNTYEEALETALKESLSLI